MLDIAKSEMDVMPRSGDRPLRVMFVITSMHVGGAEILLDQLVRRFDPARFSPEVCCLKERGALGQQLAEAYPVHAGILRTRYDVRVLGRLRKLLRRRAIDALVTVGAGDKMFWGRLAAMQAGVPVILSAVHSTGWPDQITWLNRRLTPWTDGFIAVAKSHARYLIEQEGLPASRVFMIPNGVNVDAFFAPGQNSPLREAWAAGAPTVGIVAQLRFEKNHELFLRAAQQVKREVPSAQFVVVGDGTRRFELEQLAMELGLSSSVHFLGQRTDVPSILAAIDVFALTSRVEANPVSILEAMASGKPVVATRVGSIPDLIVDGVSGYLVAPDDVAAFAQRLVELLNDRALARTMGAAGRQFVIDHASIERMVEGYQDLIEQIYWANCDGKRPERRGNTLL